MRLDVIMREIETEEGRDHAWDLLFYVNNVRYVLWRQNRLGGSALSRSNGNGGSAFTTPTGLGNSFGSREQLANYRR
jgi:hypothetical protein